MVGCLVILTQLIHPELLQVLGTAGHGTKILISDGNYPHVTGAPAAAKHVYLNLTPGLLDVDQVLDVLMNTVPVEAAEYMCMSDGRDATAITAYRAVLEGTLFVPHQRAEFYAAARHTDVGLVIATADTRAYANLLLTIGVRVDSGGSPVAR